MVDRTRLGKGGRTYNPATRLEATVLKKLTLAAGFGAGYVLGAKAGKERYAQIEAKAREIAGMPAVQSATSNVMDTAGGAADSAKQTLNDKVETITDKTSKAADKPSKGSRTSRADKDVVVDFGPGAAPMAGAAASDSAPDIIRP